MSLSQPLGQVLTPKKSNLVPALLLILGLIIALSAATYGYIESRRTEPVIIAVRAVPYGQPITAVPHISIGVSLSVIIGILAVATIASLIKSSREAKNDAEKTPTPVG